VQKRTASIIPTKAIRKPMQNPKMYPEAIDTGVFERQHVTQTK
jgi:hypothetical protein